MYIVKVKNIEGIWTKTFTNRQKAEKFFWSIARTHCRAELVLDGVVLESIQRRKLRNEKRSM
jgi:hypothetical protein